MKLISEFGRHVGSRDKTKRRKILTKIGVGIGAGLIGAVAGRAISGKVINKVYRPAANDLINRAYSGNPAKQEVIRKLFKSRSRAANIGATIGGGAIGADIGLTQLHKRNQRK